MRVEQHPPRAGLARRAALVTVAVAALLLLCGFRPFTPVKDVCPTCKPPKSDVVVLISGARIRCKVLAQNPEYYVISYLGEHRYVAKSKVGSVEWRGKERKIGPNGDQVLLKNGLVLHGTVTEMIKGRFVRVKAARHAYIAWFAQVLAVYKNGVKTAF